jgi:hypothetical protein
MQPIRISVGVTPRVSAALALSIRANVKIEAITTKSPNPKTLLTSIVFMILPPLALEEFSSVFPKDRA